MELTSVTAALAQYGPLALLFGLVLWGGLQVARGILEITREVAIRIADSRRLELEVQKARAEERLVSALDVSRRLDAIEMALRAIVRSESEGNDP